MSRTVTNYGGLDRSFDAPGACAGYRVLDPEGHRLGTVVRVFANGRGEPEYVRMKLGLFGLRTALIPVQLVEVEEKRRALVLQ